MYDVCLLSDALVWWGQQVL